MKSYEHDQVPQVGQSLQPGKIQTRTEQPSGDDLIPSLTPEMQQQAYMGCIALLTIAGMTCLIREIRLLVQTCKSKF